VIGWEDYSIVHDIFRVEGLPLYNDHNWRVIYCNRLLYVFQHLFHFFNCSILFKGTM